MGKNFWISRGVPQDARFMAAIDRTADESVNYQERFEYWRQFEFTAHPEPANVLIARIGGLYAAYFALHAEGRYEYQIQSRFLDLQIAPALMQQAGIHIEMVEPETMAAV